jgi:hypothetical protein
LDSNRKLPLYSNRELPLLSMACVYLLPYSLPFYPFRSHWAANDVLWSCFYSNCMIIVFIIFHSFWLNVWIFLLIQDDSLRSCLSGVDSYCDMQWRTEGGVQSQHPESPKFRQSRSEFPVPWKLNS